MGLLLCTCFFPGINMLQNEMTFLYDMTISFSMQMSRNKYATWNDLALYYIYEHMSLTKTYIEFESSPKKA